MTITSISFHHTMCCNCPRFTVWLVWRSSVSIPHWTHLLFFNPICRQELQKLKLYTYQWAASLLFVSLHTCSQWHPTCSPSSSSSHIPLSAIPSNPTLTHIHENQCFNPILFLLRLHHMEMFFHTFPTPVIPHFQEQTELKD